MSFQDKFTKQTDTFKIESIIVTEETVESLDYLTIQEHLRSLGYKIKLETQTKFGIQIDLAKVYPEAELKRDLKGFNYELQEDVVFVKP